MWNQFIRHYGLNSFSMQAPVSKDHIFKPSLRDGAFTLWSNHGIKSFNDNEGIFASFPQIMSKYEVPKSHIFTYLQIRSFVKTISSLFPSQPATPAIDMLLLPPRYQKVPSHMAMIKSFLFGVATFQLSKHNGKKT